MTKTVRTALLSSVALLAFEPGKAGWKIDADGKIEVRDGNPVWIDANGNEATLGGDTIARLNNENKTMRERAEKAEKVAKVFEGVDPEAAKKAIDTVSKLDAKKLIDAGEVDKVKAEISSQYETQLGELKNTNADQAKRIDAMTLSGAFAASKFIADNIAVPREMFEATFGKNFKIEDGKPVPYYPDGNKVFSKQRVGEVADVDEAFALMVDAYPHKEAILKAPGGGGSGNNGGGGNRGSGRYISRSDFAKLNPAQQSEMAALQLKGEVTITD